MTLSSKLINLSAFLFAAISAASIADSKAKPNHSDVKSTQTKPNVILVYADDISAREFPVYNASVWSAKRGADSSDKKFLAKTPIIDQMANEGVFIENAWAATVCSPSRAMIMTGRHASLHKWWHNGDYGRVPYNNWKEGMIVPLYETSPIQLGHVAQKAGYKSIWAGKTQMKHVDHQKFGFDEGVFTPGSYMFPDNPNTDFNLIKVKQGGKKVLINQDTGKQVKSYAQDSWYWKPNVALMNHPQASKPIEWWPNTKASKETFGLTTYGPDVELDFIFDFIERQHKNKQPFFVYHTNHLGHDGFDWLHPESGNFWPGTPIVNWTGEGYTRITPKITGDNGVYNTHGTVSEPGMHSHLKYLDYQMWLYIKKLKALGIADNTVIILAADNGTGGYGKHSHDRQKGTHVPLIVYAPGKQFTKQGKLNDIASMADILPTLAEIIGYEFPNGYELHGESLWPYLTTDKAQHREWIYAYKSEKQLIRGHKVLKDGNNVWWDVENMPDDLISFKKITDWQQVSQAHRDEYQKLKKVLPKFDNYHTEHDPVLPLKKLN